MEELGLSFCFAPFLPLSPRKQNCQLRKLAATLNLVPRIQGARIWETLVLGLDISLVLSFTYRYYKSFLFLVGCCRTCNRSCYVKCGTFDFYSSTAESLERKTRVNLKWRNIGQERWEGLHWKLLSPPPAMSWMRAPPPPPRSPRIYPGFSLRRNF